MYGRVYDSTVGGMLDAECVGRSYVLVKYDLTDSG